jgi:hypothetical protein
MFGIGEIVLQAYAIGLILLIIAAIAGYLIYWSLGRRGWTTLSGAADATPPVAKSELGVQEGD